MSKSLKVGTRGSLLALTQTRHVVDAIGRNCPEVAIEIVVISTKGDTHKGRLPTIGAKGFFTREIEEALLAGEVHFAVHSLKDLPVETPDGLVIGCIPAREDPSDVLVGMTCEELTAAVEPRVGTCSLRRAAQLRRAFPGCRIVDLRGNIDTRLRKVREKTVDAGVLAMAGLRRLGRGSEALHAFEPAVMLPAPGQGALGIEIREGDKDTAELLRGIHCAETAARVLAERSFMHSMGGGCHVPVAALSVIEGDCLELMGRVMSLDGSRMIDDAVSGSVAEARDIGERLAETMTGSGAKEILEESRACQAGGDDG